MVSSRLIAEILKIDHNNILRDIYELMKAHNADISSDEQEYEIPLTALAALLANCGKSDKYGEIAEKSGETAELVSSVEIAELIGKRHDSVKRSLDRLPAADGSQIIRKKITNERNQPITQYLVPKTVAAELFQKQLEYIEKIQLVHKISEIPARSAPSKNPFDNIPQELKNLNQWVAWKRVARGGAPTKVPFNARGGLYAKSDDPDTWSGFRTALRAFRGGEYDGIGFVLANGYFGVDIDHAELDSPLVLEFVRALKSYAEISPSGKGVHIIARGKLPEGGRANRKLGLETYDYGRFFTMTGNIFSEYSEIADASESVKKLHKKYFPKKPETAPKTLGREPCAERPALDEITAAIQKSKRRDAFLALDEGRWEGAYKSQSEADQAFCNMLAFWYGGDFDRMDAAFRRSGLMRPKWDARRGDLTYGEKTLNKAINDVTERYEPSRRDEYEITIKTAGKPKNIVKNAESYEEIIRNAENFMPSAKVSRNLVENAGSNAESPVGGSKNKADFIRSFDDMGMAARIIDGFGDFILWVENYKSWLRYDGAKWTRDETRKIEKSLDEIMKKLPQEREKYIESVKETARGDEAEKIFAKFMKKYRANASKTAVIKESRHLAAIKETLLDHEDYAGWLNTPGGVVSLKTGRIFPHSHRFLTTKITAAALSETASPLWEKFLRDVFSGDGELINYIKRAVGYSLTGNTGEQVFFMCFGEGGNGKSAFLEAVAGAFGDYASAASIDTFLVRPYPGGNRSDLARLKGIRFLRAGETKRGDRLDEPLVKALTGGEMVVSARKYENETEYKPQFVIWFSTNYKSKITGTDEGFWRRMQFIPFLRRFDGASRDFALASKLAAERGAILKWAVEGAVEWRRDGLKPPKLVLDATNEYRREMDPVGRFIEEKCEIGQYISKARELYCAFRGWIETAGEYSMTETAFGIEMSKRFDRVRREEGNHYLGVKLIGTRSPENILTVNLGKGYIQQDFDNDKN